MNYSEFPQSVVEKIGYYVYILKNPNDGKIFYVGKGVGNRVFNHAQNPSDSEKGETIKGIHDSGRAVEAFLVRHGLSEREAFILECAIIDILGLDSLTNEQSGHHAYEIGIKSTNEIIAQYGAEPITSVDEPVMAITVNKKYEIGKTSDDDLYDYTRKYWKVGKQRESAKYVFAVFKGIVREVYEVDAWLPSTDECIGRWYFEGKKAPESVRSKYLNKDLSGFIKQGSQNPIKYLGFK